MARSKKGRIPTAGGNERCSGASVKSRSASAAETRALAAATATTFIDTAFAPWPARKSMATRLSRGDSPKHGDSERIREQAPRRGYNAIDYFNSLLGDC